MKFLFAEIALYLYKSTIRPCMEHCCHVWTGAFCCYLELLDKLQNRICRTVGPSLAVSLEPLAHRRYVASLSLFCRSTRYFDRLHVTRMSMLTVPFLAQLHSGIICL